MITARNYAAQAKRAADGLLSKCIKDEPEALSVIGFLKCLSLGFGTAQHFALEDGGRIFNDGLKLLVGTKPRLPFESITVEYFDDGYRIAVLAYEVKRDVDDISICFCTAVSNGELWCFLPFITTIKDIHDDGVLTLGSFDSSGWIEPNDTTDQAAYAARGVLELLEALSCSNVTHEPIEKINPAVNARRIRDGKLPLYETRRLVINAGKSVGVGGGNGGTHDSPRQHLRRGHIRRHPTAGNIWINSCVVGSAELGVIEKQYHIKI